MGATREIKTFEDLREACEGLEEHIFTYYDWLGVFDDILPQLRFQAFKGYQVEFIVCEIHSAFVQFFEFAKDLTVATLKPTLFYRDLLRSLLAEIRGRVSYDNQLKFRQSLPQTQHQQQQQAPIGKRQLAIPPLQQEDHGSSSGNAAGHHQRQSPEPQICVADLKAHFIKKMDGNAFSPCHLANCQRVHYSSIPDKGFSAQVAKRQVLKVLGAGPYCDQCGQ